MTTLAEFMIIAGADNRPLMLEKSLYDSWKSRMEFYMENRKNGRMILDSVLNGPLVWPTVVQGDDTTRKKTYVELSATEKLQADCDCKATDIVLQGLPPDVYAIVNHHKVTKEIWDRVKLLMQGTKLSLQEKEFKLYDKFDKFSFVKGLAIHVFSQGDDPIACLNKVMAFLTVVASSRVTVQQVQGRQGQSYSGTGYKGNATSSGGTNTSRQARVTEDLDAYDSDCDDVSNAKAVLMANLSNYGSDVISETAVQDTNLYAQQDSMILSVIEQMSKQMINHVNNWETANQEKNNKSVTAELERYKERIKTFEQRLNVDLSSREKMIDSQMDDMIKEKLALKELVDSLEQNLSKQIKERNLYCKHLKFVY
ncbi:hypothetical protein Tco_0714561 [Tanacetum coccineum]